MKCTAGHSAPPSFWGMTERMKNLTFAALSLAALASASAQNAAAGPLDGHWKIVGWTLPDAVPVRAHLPYLSIQGGQVTGFTGCNRLTGPVTVRGNQITFGNLGTTRMSCGAAVNAQESALLGFLSGKTLTYERKVDSLTIMNGTSGATGPMLNIRRMTVAPR